MADGRMPSSGRLLEGSIAAIGCVIIIGVHSYRRAKSTALLIDGWWRTQQAAKAQERTRQQAKRAAAWDRLGTLPEDWD